MRLFFPCPSGVSFEAVGRVSPSLPPAIQIGLGARRAEVRYDIARAARGQVDVVGNAGGLQCGSDLQIVGVVVNDDVGVLHALQPRDVLAERLLAIGPELMAALREQYVAGDRPSSLALRIRSASASRHLNGHARKSSCAARLRAKRRKV